MRFDWKHCDVCKGEINMYINGEMYTYGWVDTNDNIAIYRPNGASGGPLTVLGAYPTTLQAMRALRKRAQLGVIGGEIKQ